MAETIRDGSRLPETEFGLLGMEEEVGTNEELVRRVGEGFPYEVLENFRESVGLGAGEVADLVQIDPRTSSRRKRKGRLHPDESERVSRLSRVYGRALGLFGGDLDRTDRRLSTPKVASDGEAPLDYSRVDVGAQEVVALIGRIEHGVPS
ncbi:antitoxin Xre-like helix-turn-helix domain-containing protein [Rubrobacter marinus]|nr:antitoxin Xre-like helix-turn-helix domain-containing protein [Rubrobacter marinus]